MIGRARTRRLALTAAATFAALVTAGCTVPRPEGAGTVRYRDPVFMDITKTPDIVYGSSVPQGATTPIDLKLDLYQPTGDRQTERPAVVWVHGGGYSGGDKGGGPSPDLAQKFAKLGYVTVSINYRLIASGCTGSGTIPAACNVAALDAQHDAQAAVRYLRANAATLGIDPTRIGIGGESAGAITATLVGDHSDDPGTSGNPGFPSQVEGFSSISGGVPQAIFVGPGDAPGVLFHGDADPIVPVRWSVDTAKAMHDIGIPAFLEIQHGAGHVPYAQYAQLFYEQSDYFFYDLLDLGHATGQPAAVRAAATRTQARMARAHPRYAKVLKARKRQAARIRSATRVAGRHSR